jgi:hypothetical protein
VKKEDLQGRTDRYLWTEIVRQGGRFCINRSCMKGVQNGQLSDDTCQCSTVFGVFPTHKEPLSSQQLQLLRLHTDNGKSQVNFASIFLNNFH